MTEHATDKPSERSSKRKEQTPKNPTAAHAATTMTASMNKKKQIEGATNCTSFQEQRRSGPVCS
jgi:hypothetical protein